MMMNRSGGTKIGKNFVQMPYGKSRSGIGYRKEKETEERRERANS